MGKIVTSKTNYEVRQWWLLHFYLNIIDFTNYFYCIIVTATFRNTLDDRRPTNVGQVWTCLVAWTAAVCRHSSIYAFGVSSALFWKMRNLSLLFRNTFSFSLSTFSSSKTITKRYLELGIRYLPKNNYSCFPPQIISLPSTLLHQQRVHKSTKFSRGKGSSKEDQDDDDYEDEGAIDSTVSL